MNILFIGDIVGRPGRQAVKALLPKLGKDHKIDFVIANGENLAGGIGLTEKTYQEILDAGVDFLSSGNHVWDKKEFLPIIAEPESKILRPANLPEGVPGRGFVDLTIKGQKIRLINLQGRVFMREGTDCPFRAAMKLLNKAPEIILVDFHAEATSEKVALGHFLDGKVTAVLGTHTHIQTADCQILPGGTGYITDVGMVGPKDSCIGVEKQNIIQHFLTGLPVDKPVPKSGEVVFGAVLLELSDNKLKKIQPLSIILSV